MTFRERVCEIFESKPEREFLVFVEDRARIRKTFREFEEDLRKRAASLLARVDRSTDVLVCVGGNTYSQLLNLTAGLLTGFSVMPLNGAEPEGRIREKAERTRKSCFFVRDSESCSESGRYEGTWQDLRNPAEMFFIPSSGSTGDPKIIRQPESAVLSNCDALISHHRLAEKGTWIATPLPVFHVNALEFSYLCSLLNGSRLTIFESFNFFAILKELETSPITILSVIPPVIRSLTAFADRVDWTRSALRYAVSAAAPLSREIAQAWHEVTGRPVIQGYGMSEAVNFSATMPIDLDPDTFTQLMYKNPIPSVGVALPGNELTVLGEDGTPLGENQTGELAIRGGFLMTGYVGEPDIARDKNFRTGDLAYYQFHKGRAFYFIAGRRKDVIKKSGVAISLREIDDFLASLLDPGSDAIAVPRPDSIQGENFAVVVRAAGALTPGWEERIRKALVEKFGKAYEPSAIRVTSESLRTPSGKPQRFRFSGLLLDV